MIINIVIPTYNRCLDLKQTLFALCDQEDVKQMNLEVLVIDNNSTDQTKELFKKNIFNSLPYRPIYLHETRQGKTYALNTALRYAKGDLVVFLDDDVTPERNWLRTVVHIFKKHKHIDFVCGKILPLNSSVELPDWCEWRRFKSVFGLTRYGDKSRFLDKLDPLPSGMNIAVRREVLKGAYFNHRFFSRGEDTEFCLRIREMGTKFYYTPDAILYHKIDQNRLRKKYFREYFYSSGIARSQFEEKFVKSFRFLNIPLWIASEIFLSWKNYLFFLLRGDKRKAFSAYLDFVYLSGCIKGSIIKNKTKLGRSYAWGQV